MSNLDQNTVDEITKFVETLPDAIYPTDVFPALTDENKSDRKTVEAMFPNLIARLYCDAARRTFRITELQIKERFEDNE